MAERPICRIFPLVLFPENLIHLLHPVVPAQVGREADKAEALAVVREEAKAEGKAGACLAAAKLKVICLL